MIPVYSPDVQVWLHKTIGRRTTNGKDAVSIRFSGSAARQVVDLRPFLGEGASVRTSKSVRDPAGGFSITLVDQPDQVDGAFESLYGLIEPMDMIEIRARHGVAASSAKAPIIMRGFVTEVQRVEAAASGGQPQRAVTVSGQDYGKLWQVIQIVYYAGYLVGQSYISGFNLFEQYGIPVTTMAPSEFAKEVLAKIINPYLAALMPANSTLPRQVAPDTTVGPATISPGIQTHQGTIYEMLRYYGDVGPWNELFMEDREDGVYMVYRPNPYLKTDGTGAKVQAEAPDPVYVDLDVKDLLAINLQRSDADVMNFFWVQSARFNLVYEAFQRQDAMAGNRDDVALIGYQNADPDLYGIRLMSTETQQGGPDMQNHTTGGPAADVDRGSAASANWMDARRRILVDSNRDNVVLERGTMRMRGNESIRAGTYIRLTRGALTSTYYVAQVEHEFVPFQGYFTTAAVERGTGFIERVKAAGSPYFMEQAG